MILSSFANLGRLKTSADDDWVPEDRLQQKIAHRADQLKGKFGGADLVSAEAIGHYLSRMEQQ